MKKNFQIIQVSDRGITVVLHPETNADQVLDSSTKKVPLSEEISTWNKISKDVEAAKGDKASLTAQIEGILAELSSEAILRKVLERDGSGSLLDADTVDNRTVDDTLATNNNLWTAQKTSNEIQKKVSNTEVTTTKMPGKILKTNSKGNLATDLDGNASTATRLQSAVKIELTGDLEGSFSILGDEATVTKKIEVKDDSHNHTKISNDLNSCEIDTRNILNFKKNGLTVSSITLDGNFTGDSGSVSGCKVNDLESGAKTLWTSSKIQSVIDGLCSANEITRTITLGGVKIVYGAVTLGNSQEIIIPDTIRDIKTILFDGAMIQGTDPSVNVIKASNYSLVNKKYMLNKISVGSKLNWFIVGV